MINDNQTNYLYLSDLLPDRYPTFYSLFQKELKENNIAFELLPNTKDIWARDYMPIQVSEEKYVRFVYNPDYLQAKKWQKTISETDAICEQLGINLIKSDIKLDGGNVVKWNSQVILTDRIFKENPSWARTKLLDALQGLLELDRIILIPQQPKDYLGHSDGAIRFLDDKTVLINDLSKELDWYQSSFLIALHNAGLAYEILSYNVYGNKKYEDATGTYINFLEMENAIFMPTFGLHEDDMAFKKMSQLYPGRQIVKIPSNEVSLVGGVLNCISWNIKR